MALVQIRNLICHFAELITISQVRATAQCWKLYRDNYGKWLRFEGSYCFAAIGSGWSPSLHIPCVYMNFGAAVTVGFHPDVCDEISGTNEHRLRSANVTCGYNVGIIEQAGRYRRPGELWKGSVCFDPGHMNWKIRVHDDFVLGD